MNVIAAAAELANVTYDQAAILQMADTKLLVASAAGTIDLNAMARDELASRGMDASGKWVGFAAASL
jgi:hypothetical protein